MFLSDVLLGVRYQRGLGTGLPKRLTFKRLRLMRCEGLPTSDAFGSFRRGRKHTEHATTAEERIRASATLRCWREQHLRASHVIGLGGECFTKGSAFQVALGRTEFSAHAGLGRTRKGGKTRREVAVRDLLLDRLGHIGRKGN